MQIPDHGQKVLPYPWIVCVSYAMLFADFPNSWSNIWVPDRTHSGKKMMLNLEVETSSERTTYEATVGAGCLNLALVPTYLLTILTGNGHTLSSFENMREHEQDTQREKTSYGHHCDVRECDPPAFIALKWSDNIAIQVEQPKQDCVFSSFGEILTVHLHTRFSCPLMF